MRMNHWKIVQAYRAVLLGSCRFLLFSSFCDSRLQFFFDLAVALLGSRKKSSVAIRLGHRFRSFLSPESLNMLITRKIIKIIKRARSIIIFLLCFSFFPFPLVVVPFAGQYDDHVSHVFVCQPVGVVDAAAP